MGSSDPNNVRRREAREVLNSPGANMEFAPVLLLLEMRSVHVNRG